MRELTIEELTFVAGGDYGGGGAVDGSADTGDDSGDIVVTAPSGGGDDTGSDTSNSDSDGASSASSTGPDIIVTAPRGNDHNYEIQVPDATKFACPVGNVPFFGNYGTPSGTLGAGTHITLTPAAYNKVAKGCVFNSGAGAYHLQAQ